MKNVFSLLKPLLLIFFVPIAFLGCQKSIKTQHVLENIKLNADNFDFFGTTHNDALDYIYDNTFAINPNTNFNDVKNACSDYLYRVNPQTKISNDDKTIFNKAEFKNLIKSAVNSNSIFIDSVQLIKRLTVPQYNMIRRLDQLITSTSLTFENRIAEIRKLEDEAINTLNDNEIVYFLCTSNLSRHSLAYWNSEKGKRWIETINKNYNNNATTYSASIDWHNVAVADVAAFAVGFPAGVNVGMIAGGLTAGIASAGITAGVGAALGGIVGGSVSGLATAISASAVTLAAEAVVSWFS